MTVIHATDGVTAPESFRAFEYKMEAYGMQPQVVNIFKRLYSEVLSGKTGMLHESNIEPLGDEDIVEYGDLGSYEEAGRKAMHQAVMIKLNGGLGTSMGLEKAKSLIEIKNGLTFLDVIIRQTQRLRQRFHNELPLVFMNSFKTHMDTMLEISGFDNGSASIPLAFVQNRFPKVLQKDFSPANWPSNPELEWNPPGHGDIYTALYTSGLLNTLLRRGRYYAFISNSDNLGATMDPSILGYMASNRLPFVMEVAQRTASDRKGGHLAKMRHTGRLLLREVAQCPEEELESFQDVQKFSYFNTNSLWIDLRELEQVLFTKHMMPLDIIVNPKTLDPRDSESPKVFQIETAMGSAISAFDRAGTVCVPRSRFAPVKTTNDLLMVMSDCYLLSPEGNIEINHERKFPLPYITLDSKYFKKIDDFSSRFPDGAPSLLECNSLNVEGDIRFSRNVTLKGDVLIRNFSTEQAVIPDKESLSGEVRINGV